MIDDASRVFGVTTRAHGVLADVALTSNQSDLPFRMSNDGQRMWAGHQDLRSTGRDNN